MKTKFSFESFRSEPVGNQKVLMGMAGGEGGKFVTRFRESDDPWEDNWKNLAGLAQYHPDQKKFVSDLMGMPRMRSDIARSREKAGMRALEKMEQLISLARKLGVVVPE